MATLAKHPGGPRVRLLSRHLVGRSRAAELRLDDPKVSGEHAVLRWTGREWELHHLGSRNGTFLDGRRLALGERVVVPLGAEIAFGDAGNTWRLSDADPPALMAMPADAGEPVCARGDLLALPDDDHPEVVGRIFTQPLYLSAPDR